MKPAPEPFSALALANANAAAIVVVAWDALRFGWTPAVIAFALPNIGMVVLTHACAYRWRLPLAAALCAVLAWAVMAAVAAFTGFCVDC